MWSTWPILKESVLLLLDASHSEEMVSGIKKELSKMKEVKEIKDLKIWSTNRGKHYAAVKVTM